MEIKLRIRKYCHVFNTVSGMQGIDKARVHK